MRTDLLLLVADYLENVVANMPPERFRMDHWQCGTACCAIGHAADIPELKEMGLRIEESFICGLEEEEDIGQVYFGTEEGWPAVYHLFDAQDDISMTALFEGQDGDTPKIVAQRIRRFVCDGMSSLPAIVPVVTENFE